MKSLLKKISIYLSTLAIVLTATAPLPALAATKDDVCDGLALTGTQGCDPAATAAAESNVEKIIQTVINLLSLAVGIIAVIFIIIGGLKYVTSSGDSNNVNSAKNTILYALIGLVIVVLAQVIVRFVLGQVDI